MRLESKPQVDLFANKSQNDAKLEVDLQQLMYNSA